MGKMKEQELNKQQEAYNKGRKQANNLKQHIKGIRDGIIGKTPEENNLYAKAFKDGYETALKDVNRLLNNKLNSRSDLK